MSWKLHVHIKNTDLFVDIKQAAKNENLVYEEVSRVKIYEISTFYWNLNFI